MKQRDGLDSFFAPARNLEQRYQLDAVHSKFLVQSFNIDKAPDLLGFRLTTSNSGVASSLSLLS